MQDFRSRFIKSTVVLGVAFLAIIFRLWYLQIVEGDELAEFSLSNHIRSERIPAYRGRILDRHGREFVVNRPSFDVYLLPRGADDYTKLNKALFEILQVSPERFKNNLVPTEPILIARDIDRDQLAYIETRRDSLPGVIVEINNLRRYIYGSLGASFLGYLGKISKAELEVAPLLGNDSLVGKRGVEKGWQDFLQGEDGYRQKATDAFGREVSLNLFQKNLTSKVGVPGHDVVLSIDIDIQRAVEEALGDKSGAVVVVDVKSGELLALASKPSFSPLDFVKGVNVELWKVLINDKSFPLLNRSTQGLYAPGSVLKMVTAVAALSEGTVEQDTLVYCPGRYKFGRRTFHCWKREGHGEINLKLAIIGSCNVYFYKLAEKLDIDRLSRYMKAFGFGSPTGIGIEESRGIVPSRRWKQTEYKKSWYRGETLISAIGQGYVSVTPLQVAMMTVALANGGTLYKPIIVRKVVSHDGKNVAESIPEVRGVLPPMHREALVAVRNAMIGAVNDPKGTGRAAKLSNYTVAGKTGTAQVVSLDKEEEGYKEYKGHAWFTSYAPAENPEVSVTVLIEHGGKGGSVAAPIARKVIEAYRSLEDKRDKDDRV